MFFYNQIVRHDPPTPTVVPGTLGSWTVYRFSVSIELQWYFELSLEIPMHI